MRVNLSLTKISQTDLKSLGTIMFRFANIFKLSNISVGNIQTVVKKVKSETSLDIVMYCNNNRNMFNDNNKRLQVKAVEEMLQIKSSEQILETLTNEDLKNAAEMFLYLNTCPDLWFKSWASFYKDLFLAQPPDKIILTLNRMTKYRTKDGKQRAEKLLQRIKILLSLKFEEIQRLLQKKEFRIEYVKKDLKIPNGTH